jgi:fused signal recognition particle receptor
MEWMTRLLSGLTDLLARFGVPAAYRNSAALALVYLLATLVVLLLVMILIRRGRAPAPGEEEETPVSREQGTEPPPELEVEPVGKTKSEPAAEPEVEAEVDVESLQRPAIGSAEEAVSAEAESGELQEVEAGPAEEPVAAQVEVAPPAVSLFDRMRAGLAKTQAGLVGKVDTLLRGRQVVDAELLEELEDILVSADFGIKTAQELIATLEKRLPKGGDARPETVRELLKEEIRERLRLEAAPLDPASVKPFVIMVVGVNGVGKTTTIGKLARQFAQQGNKVVLGAGDTFRAAAADQLAIWGERAGVTVVRHAEGADPAAVAFDAAKAAVARKADILILDTAGRLHTKVNLMEEMKKIRRVLGREIPGAPHETLLVLDATTGQNALVQARLFKEAVQVSGLALTKLDGTARGGVVVAICAELGLPVRYVGIGEGVDDLRPFDPDLFVNALFQRD